MSGVIVPRGLFLLSLPLFVTLFLFLSCHRLGSPVSPTCAPAVAVRIRAFVQGSLDADTALSQQRWKGGDCSWQRCPKQLNSRDTFFLGFWRHVHDKRLAKVVAPSSGVKKRSYTYTHTRSWQSWTSCVWVGGDFICAWESLVCIPVWLWLASVLHLGGALIPFIVHQYPVKSPMHRAVTTFTTDLIYRQN